MQASVGSQDKDVVYPVLARRPPLCLSVATQGRGSCSKAEPTGDGGFFSRRSIPASGGFTMQPFSHAPPLGRLCLASRVHFRGSYFTTGDHPPAAITPRALLLPAKVGEVLTCFPSSRSLIPQSRFVTHTSAAAVRSPTFLRIQAALQFSIRPRTEAALCFACRCCSPTGGVRSPLASSPSCTIRPAWKVRPQEIPPADLRFVPHETPPPDNGQAGMSQLTQQPCPAT